MQSESCNPGRGCSSISPYQILLDCRFPIILISSLPLSTLFFQEYRGLMRFSPATRQTRLTLLPSYHTAGRSLHLPLTFSNCWHRPDALGIDCLVVIIFVALSDPQERGKLCSMAIITLQDGQKNAIRFVLFPLFYKQKKSSWRFSLLTLTHCWFSFLCGQAKTAKT